MKILNNSTHHAELVSALSANSKIIIFFNSILIILSVVSCLKTPDEISEEQGIILPDENEIFNTNTQPISPNNAVTIEFSNGQAIIENPYQENGVTINVVEQHVTIRSTLTNTDVNYVLSGKTTAGSVKIYSEYRFGLVLNGVSIQNPQGAAINIQSGKRISVTLVDKTSNRLIDEGVFQFIDGEDMKGTFFSEGQLIFNGEGSLLIYSNYGHAICSDDFIQINNGRITVNNAIRDGFHCNEYLQINGGNIEINKAKSDGLECEKGYIIVSGGSIKVNNCGEKGLKSADKITITGGKIELTTKDNGLQSVKNIVVAGGEIFIDSNKTGTLSAEGQITVAGGLLISSAKNNAFDCGTFSITGGRVVGVGSATVKPTADVCTQRSVVWGASGFTAEQLIFITSTNSEIMTFKLPRTYSENMALVFSAPSLQADASYTIFKGGTVSGDNNFNGFYNDATSSGGTEAAKFTTSSMVTTIGNVNY